MSDAFITDLESVSRIYGDTFYIVPGGDSESSAENGAEKRPVRVELESVAKAPQVPDVAPAVVVQNHAGGHPVNPEQPVTGELPATPIPSGLQWRVKPTSKMLFILHQSEMRDAELTDFLRKIVTAIGIPFETAGFGIIAGEFDLRTFENMPNRYGVVFDGSIWHKPHAMAQFGDNEVFFTERLAVLQNDKEAKVQLWNYLKNLKDTLV